MDNEKKPAAPTVEVEIKPPSTDEVMDAEREITDAKLAGMAGQPPTPTEPIQVSKMAMLRDALNAAIAFLTDGAAPKITAEFDRTAGSTQAPIPAPLWLPLFELSKVAEMVAHVSPDVGSPFAFDPQAIVTGSGVSDVTGKLQQMSRSKEFKDEVLKMAEAAKAQMESEGPGKPSESSEKDEYAGTNAPAGPTPGME